MSKHYATSTMRPVKLNEILERITVRYIEKALQSSKGNRKEAARILGIGRTNLVMKLKARGMTHYMRPEDFH